MTYTIYLVGSCHLELLGTCWYPVPGAIERLLRYYILVLLCVSYAHNLGWAVLGAGREAGRPCLLAGDTYKNDLEHRLPRLAPRNMSTTYVWATHLVYHSTAAAVIAIGHHTPQARWL